MTQIEMVIPPPKNSITKILVGAIVFFFIALVILSFFRFAFWGCYLSGDGQVTVSEAFRAFWMGIRIDAKWLSLFLVPAWVVLILSIFFKKLTSFALLLAVVGLFVMVVLDSINFGFYGFYKSPINPLIFGFFQDDTEAILKTLWSDWPVLSYVLVIFLATSLPMVSAIFLAKRVRTNLGRGSLILAVIMITLLQAFLIRGSLGRFPLRQEDLAVSKIPLVNYSVTNGCQALYESYKSMKALKIQGDPLTPIKDFGFSDEAQAKKILGKHNSTNISRHVISMHKPNVVFAVMESMSADVFKSHDTTKNNVLGSLENALKTAIVFKNCVSVQNGTFPSLEGLLFNTPLTPLSQSGYGRQRLGFSQIWPFKEAGYKTIFLTGAPESWRQISETFVNYGFDEIYGSSTIAETFPNAEVGPWGIGDKWLFQFAEKLVKEAEESKKPVFLMILSTTNHPPFKVPDGDAVLPVNADFLPSIINKDSPSREEVHLMLQTYQYASNALGSFVGTLGKEGWLNNTIVVATGDHNARFSYEVDGNWHRVFGVPLIFWLPDHSVNKNIDASLWVSHRDIFPTLLSLALGKESTSEKGRDLFSEKPTEGAVSFIDLDGGQGFVIGEPGLVVIRKSKNPSPADCYRWDGRSKLIQAECKGDLESMRNRGRAQRALSEVEVRKGLTVY